MKKPPNYYAIVTIHSNRRVYWCRSQRKWAGWHDATRFTQNERKAYPLPKGGWWVSVLHGMGADSYYVTEQELRG